MSGTFTIIDIDQTSVDDQNSPLSSAVDEVGSLFWKMTIDDAGDASFIGPSGNFCFPTVSDIAQPTSVNASLDMDSDASNESFVACFQNEAMKSKYFQLFALYINPAHQFVESPFTPSGEMLSLSHLLLHCAILAARSCLSSRPEAHMMGNIFAEHAEKIALAAVESRHLSKYYRRLVFFVGGSWD